MSFVNPMTVKYYKKTTPKFTNTFGLLMTKNIEPRYSIPNGVTKIRDYCFIGCGGILDTITISNTVTTIGVKAFSDCGLQTITIPPSVTEIGESAFENAYNLTEINFSEGLKTIKKRAFCGTQITRIRLPNSLETIEEEAFADIGNDKPVLIYVGNKTLSIAKNSFDCNVTKFTINQNPWALTDSSLIPWGAWADETPITWIGTSQTLSRGEDINGNVAWLPIEDPDPTWR